MASNRETKCKQDQTSHKVIEKRRRDRINNCLAELSQTVPSAFAKQSIKIYTDGFKTSDGDASAVCAARELKSSGKLEKAEILEMTVEYLRVIQGTEIGMRFDNGEWFSSDICADFLNHYRTGYGDCMREIMRYMTDVEGMNASDDRCLRLITHLQTRFRPDISLTNSSTHRGTFPNLCTDVRDMKMISGNTNNPGCLYRYNPYIVPLFSTPSRENKPNSISVNAPQYLNNSKSLAIRSSNTGLPVLLGSPLNNTPVNSMKSNFSNSFPVAVTQPGIATTNSTSIMVPPKPDQFFSWDKRMTTM